VKSLQFSRLNSRKLLLEMGFLALAFMRLAFNPKTTGHSLDWGPICPKISKK
jgi:hypothetical protein